MALIRAFVVGVVASLALVAPEPMPAQAACAPSPVPGPLLPGVDHDPTLWPDRRIGAVAWDPDGPGPQSELLVVWGSMRAAGNTVTNGAAVFDPATGTWADLATPFLPTAFFAGPNGELLALASDASFNWSLFRRSGSSWIANGYFNERIAELIWLPNGQLLASGYFTVIDPGLGANLSATGLAVWNGAAWQPFAQLRNPQWGQPGNPAIGIPSDVQLLANGELVVSGVFTEVDMVPVQGIARWNGSQWDDMSGGPFGSAFGRVLAEDNGTLLANVGVNAFAAWTGFGWVPYPSLPAWASGVQNPYGRELRTTATGLLLAFGFDGIAVRTGSGWVDLPWDNVQLVAVVSMQSGDLFAVGEFEQVVGVPALRIARFDTQGSLPQGQWQALGDGFAGPIRAVLRRPGGDRLFGGTFGGHDGILSSPLVRFDGVAWSDVAPGVGAVAALANAPGGEALAIGEFHLGATSGVQPIARVVGNSLMPLPTAAFWSQHQPLALATDAVGDTLIGCRQIVTGAVVLARWNGTSLSSVSLPGLRGEPRAILVEGNGELTLGGAFDAAGTAWHVVRWDGSAWTGQVAVASGIVQAMHREGAGDLLVGGTFSTVIQGTTPAFTNCGRWDGSQFLPVAGIDTPVSAFADLPNGDVLAAGALLTRLRGSAVDRLAGFAGLARDLIVDDDGTIEVVGDFGVAGPVLPNGTVDHGAAAYRLRLEPPCPATAAAIGVGCVGPAGTVTLTAETHPWIAATFRWTTSHVPVGSVVLQVLGLGPVSSPLSMVFPAAGAGCTILATPDLLLPLAVPAPGTTAAGGSLVVPAIGSLVGQSLYLQTYSLQFPGGVVAAQASNALRLNFGAL